MISVDIVTRYLLDNLIIPVEEQTYGPMLEAAVKFFVRLDHTALLPQAEFLAVVGINLHL